jgi:hypothetical protein
MLKRTGSAVAIVAGLSLVFVGSLAAQVPSSWLGTWKLNVAKSKYDPGPGQRSNISRWEAVPGGGLKIVGDAVDAAGKSTHTQVVTMFDGKEAELKGADVPTTRVYTKIDDRTYEFVTRINGKVTTTSRGTMSPDGKTRTLVTTGTNAEGKPVKNSAVYERQ